MYLWVVKRISWKHGLVFTLTFVASASLIITQLAANPKEYFSHHKTISVFNQAEFKAGNRNEKLEFIYRNGFKKTKAFMFGHLADGADGYGDFQSIDYLILVFSTGGLITAIIKRNNYLLWLFVGLIIQLIPLFSTVDGYYRRVLIAYIFLYVFAAYALHEILQAVKTKQKTIVISVVSLFALAQITLNLWQYFIIFPSSSMAKFVFSPGVYAGLEAIDDNADILLYSERYSCEYETFRFLLKGRNCIHYEGEITPVNSAVYVKLYIDSFIPTGLKKNNAISLYDTNDRIIAVVAY